MKPRTHSHARTFAALSVLLILILLIAGCRAICPACPDPCPDPCAAYETGALPPDPEALSFAVGDSNFTNLVASGDITVGDDIAVTGDLSVGNGTPSTTLNGEDAYVEGTFEVDGAVNLDGAVDMDSTLDVAGNVSDGAGTFTIADDVLIDGQADAVQLSVQEVVTPTGAALVVEDSSGTDVVSIHVAEASAGSWDFIDITDTTPILDGSDTVIGLDMNITGANHTGASNVIYGIDLDLTTADAEADEVAIELTDTDWDTGIKSVLNLENILLPTVASAAITTSSDGAIWTVGASEVWYIDRVFCNVTTNFDCTGDDCTIEIGLTGGDIDGFLDLDDGELQAADAEISGLTAGWQGFGSTDTRGAFFAAGAGVILANDTIDIKIEDNSDQSNPTAGAATCYIVYTRLQ